MLNLSIAGIVGKQAETREYNGQQVTSFSVAVKTRKKDEEGKPITQWVECSYWGEQGAKVAQYLEAKTRVAVSGSFSLKEYQKRDGGTGVSVELRVDSLTLMGDGGQRHEEEQKPAPAPQQRSARSRFG
jgi:single-strand DNA-binding protein